MRSSRMGLLLLSLPSAILTAFVVQVVVLTKRTESFCVGVGGESALLMDWKSALGPSRDWLEFLPPAVCLGIGYGLAPNGPSALSRRRPWSKALVPGRLFDTAVCVPSIPLQLSIAISSLLFCVPAHNQQPSTWQRSKLRPNCASTPLFAHFSKAALWCAKLSPAWPTSRARCRTWSTTACASRSMTAGR